MRIVSKSTGPLHHLNSDRANMEGFVPFEMSCCIERILSGSSKGRQLRVFTLRYSHIDSSGIHIYVLTTTPSCSHMQRLANAITAFPFQQ
jgi:hypothetical protein